MTTPTGLLSEEHQLRWIEATYAVRSCDLALAGAVDPVPESRMRIADAGYPWEKVSAWSRSYLTAGIEHMMLWADLVAPYEFDEGKINQVRFLPYLLMGRAGLESGSHAVWLLTGDDPLEWVRRLLRVMYKDFNYQRKAREAGGYPTEITVQRMADMVERAKQLNVGTSPKDAPPGYGSLVKEAAATVGRDPDRWAYLWNAASGAGHGQNWFGMEGYDVELGEEYEPGHFRSMRMPDATYITEVVEAAVDALQWGTWRWLELCGFDAQARMTDAITEIASRMPKKG